MSLQKNNHQTLPNAVGISLKSEHYHTILETKPDIGWLECHPENYMGDGGLPHYFLSKIREHYPLSMHGVGLSLGSTTGIEKNHLNKLKTVVNRYQPAQVSEHLAWSHWNSIFLNDLLPIPYTEEFLGHVSANIHVVQDALKRRILIENPSVYLGFNNSEMSETEFLNTLVKKTGCGLLLDINNVYISANNQHYSHDEYINNFPLEAVGEIHLAGHTENIIESGRVLIDDHGSSVTDNVWALFLSTIEKMGRTVPSLIEWDTNIPELPTLLKEANKAQKLMTKVIRSDELI